MLLSSAETSEEKREQVLFQTFIEDVYLPWYKTQVKESTYRNRYSTINKHFSYFYKMVVDGTEPIYV